MLKAHQDCLQIGVAQAHNVPLSQADLTACNESESSQRVDAQTISLFSKEPNHYTASDSAEPLQIEIWSGSEWHSKMMV